MASTVLKEYRKYFTPLQSPWVSPLTANSSYFCSLCVPFSSLFLCADPFQFSVVWASSFQLSQFCLQPMFSMQFWQAYFSRHWLFLFKLFILCPFLRLFFFFSSDHCLWPLAAPSNDFFLTHSETFEVGNSYFKE